MVSLAFAVFEVFALTSPTLDIGCGCLMAWCVKFLGKLHVVEALGNVAVANGFVTGLCLIASDMDYLRVTVTILIVMNTFSRVASNGHKEPPLKIRFGHLTILNIHRKGRLYTLTGKYPRYETAP